MAKKVKNIGIVILALAIFYFPCFLQLKKAPIRLWDESRLAMNAAEMFHSGISLVTTYMGAPDLWNTKPPLMIWLQVLFMKWLGVNELSIRLPSAIAGFLTCILILFFLWKKFKQPFWGLISTCVLLSSGGYVAFHVLRTGDYDALLILFMTAFCLLYYEWLNKPERKILYVGFCLFVLLAIYTKGISGLMIFPGLLVWTIYKRKLTLILRMKITWLGILLVLAGTLMYYWGRETMHPGYLEAVWNNELGGRFGTALEGHQHPFWFYIKMFFDINEFYFWWIFVIIGGIVSFKNKEKPESQWVIFLLIISFFFLLVISMAGTKLEWYKAPLFPFLSIVAGYGLLFTLEKISRFIFPQKTSFATLLSILLALITIGIPYYKNVKWAYSAPLPDWEKGYYNTSKFLKNSIKKDISLDGSVVAIEGYTPHVYFYQYVLKDLGQEISFTQSKDIIPGQKIIAGQVEIQSYIDTKFNVDTIYEFDAAQYYYIRDYK